MITNRGREIIARFLASQTPAAFSYIAVGVGPKPTSGNDEDASLFSKKSLDFEALRVPITTASVLFESGKSKIVFSGVLPTNDRYEITEIGLYPAKDNSLLTTTKDLLMFTVLDAENWTESGGSDIAYTSLAPGLDISPVGANADLQPAGTPGLSQTLTTFAVGSWYEVAPLNGSGTITAGTLDGSPLTFTDNKAYFRATATTHAVIATAGTATAVAIRKAMFAFFVPATDPALLTDSRLLQRSRVGDDALLIRGDYSNFSNDDPSTWVKTGSYVYVENVAFDLSKARADDEIKIAASLLPRVYNDIVSSLTDAPDPVGIKLSLVFSHDSETAQADWFINSDSTSSVLPETVSFPTNQYYVATKKMKDLIYTADFKWSKVNTLKIYVAAGSNGTTESKDYWVCLDAIRFDSKNDNNPIYGLVSYSVVSNPDQEPQVKRSGLESQIEYKVFLDSD